MKFDGSLWVLLSNQMNLAGQLSGLSGDKYEQCRKQSGNLYIQYSWIENKNIKMDNNVSYLMIIQSAPVSLLPPCVVFCLVLVRVLLFMFSSDPLPRTGAHKQHNAHRREGARSLSPSFSLGLSLFLCRANCYNAPKSGKTSKTTEEE